MQQTLLFPWGISSWLFAEENGLAALEKLAAAGAEQVELWGNTCHFDSRFFPPDPITVKQRLNALHLTPCSLHAPFSGFDARMAEEELRQAWLIQVKKAIEYAAAVGSGIVIVHPMFISQYPGLERLEVVDCGDALLRAVFNHARAHGVRIALENMRRQRAPRYAQTAHLKAIIERLGDDTAGICFDTGHALSNGVDFSSELRTAGERLIALHVNDNRRGDLDLHLPPGEGEVDWRQFLNDLEDIHYKGVFLMEIRGEPDMEPVIGKIEAFIESRLSK